MRAKRDPSKAWGHTDPRKLENLLIEASERIVKADSAMEDTLNAVRAGSRSRVKANISYLLRLLKEADRYMDRANQEIGF